MEVLQRLPLFMRTGVRLRPVQWVYFPLRRVQARLALRPRVPRSWSTLSCPGLTEAVLDLGPPEDARVRAERVLGGRFSFIGRSLQLGSTPDWNDRHESHLWSYNLHAFDYARDLAWAYREAAADGYLAAFGRLVQSWISGTSPGRGDGWEPFPVSARIINWVQALTVLGSDLDPAIREEATRSLALQARWLESRLERHLQANHLLKNFVALAWAGLYLGGRDADRWKRKGLRGVWRSVREQLLRDGTHYERSPMYHALALADLLELLCACRGVGTTIPNDVRELVGRGIAAYGVLCRADGRLNLFNDAAEGIAPSRSRLQELTVRAGYPPIPEPDGILDLPAAGYFGYAGASGDRLLLDCGLPGPRHQPGHAHCDLLSFELDLRGSPVVVDSGVSGYGDDPLRGYARSTRAHNTVTINGRDQSEVWGTFRMARMARVHFARHQEEGGEYRFEGAYSPYHDRRVRHQRSFRLTTDSLSILDRVRGMETVDMRSYLHLHPDLQIVSREPFGMLLMGPDRSQVRVAWHGVDRVRIGRGGGDPEGWYCPAFGHPQPALVMVGERRTAHDGEEFGYEISRQDGS